MRYLMSLIVGCWVLTAFTIDLQAQVTPPVEADQKIQDEHETLMAALSLPTDGKEISEEEAKSRAVAFSQNLDAFVLKWKARESDLRRGRLVLGRALSLAGKPAEAVPHYQYFVQRYGDDADSSEGWIALGTAHLDAKQYDDAAAVLTRFMKKHSESEQLHVADFYLALARIHLGAYDDALARLDVVAGSGKEDPIVADAAIKSIELLRDIGRSGEALKRVNALISKHGDESQYLKALKEQLDNIGKQAPKLVKVEAWLQGGPVTLAESQGSVVVLNFFADRYPACVAELKALTAMSQKLAGSPVKVVGITKFYRPVAQVSKTKQLQALSEFLRAQGVSIPVGVSTTFDNLRAYGVRGIPHTVVIDRAGVIRFVKTGGSRLDGDSLKHLESAIRRALN